MRHLSRRSWSAAAGALALCVLVAAPMAPQSAEARAGGGFSFGSRGSRSFSAPAATATAPRVSPFQGSEVSRSRPGMAGQPRRFGFGSALMAGLFGAGLLGLFTGAGFFGGIAALFGLLFKLALVGFVVWLLLRLFRRRAQPAMAGLSSSYTRPEGGLGAGVLPGAAPRAASGGPVTIGPEDYAAFERALGMVQDAYSREDLDALSRLATPQMMQRFSGDIAGNRQRGVRNDVSQVRLLQGDLSESWREGAADYASVAMRFSGVDVMVDRGSGRIVAGDPVRPTEAVELWTFRRDGRGPWILSGLQQAG